MSSVGPESTTAALAAGVPLESEKEHKPSGLPGTFPETPAADLNKEFSINPLPAAPGAVNPISLAPGEKIPDQIHTESTNSNVKLDAESYEKADTLPCKMLFQSSPVFFSMLTTQSWSCNLFLRRSQRNNRWIGCWSASRDEQGPRGGEGEPRKGPRRP